MSPSRPTLADIAQLAGVSIPTVSKVLNSRSDVAESTRERVVAAVHELGYAPRGATNPVRHRHSLVHLLIGGIGSLWSLEVLRGAEEAVARHGQSLVVSSTYSEAFSVDTWLESLITHKSQGAIIATSRVAPADIDRLRSLNIPVVILDPGSATAGNFAQVGVTNWAGSREATQHLIDLGHRRIGFICGPEDFLASHDRLEGYTAALRRNGIDADPALIAEGDFLAATGEAATEHFLGLPDRPTAIVASSDLEAMGVYHVARERGLRIPEHLSIVGFDDTMICEQLSPALTSVRQPLSDMAEHAVRLLGTAQSSTDQAPPRVELATRLIVRRSTGPAPTP